MDRPRIVTLDIFGTVLDWRLGLVEAAAAQGVDVDERQFESVIDHQARAEAEPYRPYADIMAESLVRVLGLELGHSRRNLEKSVDVGVGRAVSRRCRGRPS